MILRLERRKLREWGKLVVKVLLLVLLLLFLVPQLVALLWEEITGPKIHDDRLPDKPLKVISSSMSNT